MYDIFVNLKKDILLCKCVLLFIRKYYCGIVIGVFIEFRSFYWIGKKLKGRGGKNMWSLLCVKFYVRKFNINCYRKEIVNLKCYFLFLSFEDC